jgi:hypothetical protein
MGVKEKLNEWHLADYCLQSIQEKGSATFSIVRRDRNPKFPFSGILRDKKGNIFEIADEESGNLFETLIQVHDLVIEEDHTHTELIIRPKSIDE